MFYSGIPVIVPGLWSAIEDQATVSDVDVPVVDSLALLPEIVLEETVCLTVKSAFFAIVITLLSL